MPAEDNDYPPEWAYADYQEYCRHVVSLERHEIIAGTHASYHERDPRDGHIAFGASFLIESYLQERPIGRVFRPAPGFQLCSDPVTMRVPDVAYLAAHRLAQYDTSELWVTVPDLIVEVLTQPSRQREIDARISDFFAAGTEIAWVVNACDRTCRVRWRNGREKRYGYDQKVYAAPVLPRLCLRVYELFE